MKIYIPSYLGDIQLIAEENKTKVVYSELTLSEREKLNKFLKHYGLKAGEAAATVILPDDLVSTHKRFLKVFKPDKPILNVIKYKDGKITLMKEFNVPRAEVGVSVEKPERGCPMPTLLERAEIRAYDVLAEFLNPKQKLDFDTNRAFIARGNYTGYPYLVISRWNPACANYGLLYCLPTKRRICASLSDFPPSEEVLAMKFSIELNEFNFMFGEVLND